MRERPLAATARPKKKTKNEAEISKSVRPINFSIPPGGISGKRGDLFEVATVFSCPARNCGDDGAGGVYGCAVATGSVA